MRQSPTATTLLLLGAATLSGCNRAPAASAQSLAAKPIAAATWRDAAPLAEARQELYPEVLGGKIYVAGGINNPNTRFTDSFDSYDLATDRWTKLASLPAARHHITLTAVNGRIYGIGLGTDPARRSASALEQGNHGYGDRFAPRLRQSRLDIVTQPE